MLHYFLGWDATYRRIPVRYPLYSIEVWIVALYSCGCPTWWCWNIGLLQFSKGETEIRKHHGRVLRWSV